MEQQNQALGVPLRLIEQGQQRPGSRCSTGQSWHGNFNGYPLIVRKIHLTQGVAQGLQVTTDPGPALLKRWNPSRSRRLGLSTPRPITSCPGPDP